jgi:hypothetical protein
MCASRTKNKTQAWKTATAQASAAQWRLARDEERRNRAALAPSRKPRHKPADRETDDSDHETDDSPVPPKPPPGPSPGNRTRTNTNPFDTKAIAVGRSGCACGAQKVRACWGGVGRRGCRVDAPLGAPTPQVISPLPASSRRAVFMHTGHSRKAGTSGTMARSACQQAFGPRFETAGATQPIS